jgi:N-acetylglutamate synthase-like GNAT family acetyltransferase
MTIRQASPDDVNQITLLASQKRRQYEKYQPLFHKESPAAVGLHGAFLRDSLSKENTVVWVSETVGRLDGFIIGILVNAPPVYTPGGKICLVDDFMVESPSLWATIGRELLARVMASAKERGAVLANVVCGPLDLAKRDFLSEGGFSVASEWHIRKID